jgi:hypothetical protein
VSSATAIFGVIVTSLVFRINPVAAIFAFGFLVIVHELIVHSLD